MPRCQDGRVLSMYTKNGKHIDTACPKNAITGSVYCSAHRLAAWARINLQPKPDPK